MNHVFDEDVRDDNGRDTIMELKELIWLCKHMKNVRSSQPCTLMNFGTQFLYVGIVNRYLVKNNYLTSLTLENIRLVW